MYRIIRIDNIEIGVTDNVMYIARGESGDFHPSDEEHAIGIAFESVAYNLLGHNEIEDADVVTVQFVNAGDYMKQVAQNVANIDYIAMMSGIDLPTEDEPVEYPRDNEEE